MIEGDTWHQVDSDSEQPDSQEGGSDSDKEEDNVNAEYKSWTQRRARRQRQYKGIKSVQVRFLKVGYQNPRLHGLLMISGQKSGKWHILRIGNEWKYVPKQCSFLALDTVKRLLSVQTSSTAVGEVLSGRSNPAQLERKQSCKLASTHTHTHTRTHTHTHACTQHARTRTRARTHAHTHTHTYTHIHTHTHTGRRDIEQLAAAVVRAGLLQPGVGVEQLKVALRRGASLRETQDSHAIKDRVASYPDHAGAPTGSPAISAVVKLINKMTLFDKRADREWNELVAQGVEAVETDGFAEALNAARHQAFKQGVQEGRRQMSETATAAPSKL